MLETTWLCAMRESFQRVSHGVMLGHARGSLGISQMGRRRVFVVCERMTTPSAMRATVGILLPNRKRCGSSPTGPPRFSLAFCFTPRVVQAYYEKRHSTGFKVRSAMPGCTVTEGAPQWCQCVPAGNAGTLRAETGTTQQDDTGRSFHLGQLNPR